MRDWPFADPPNVAVFTRRAILDGSARVQRVTHDEDGAWQFHPAGAADGIEDAAVVSLAAMLRLEPDIASLADLPAGWSAWRRVPGAPWERRAEER